MKTKDKEALLAFLKAIDDLPRPEIKTLEVAEIAVQVHGMLARLNKWVYENINNV